MFLHRQKLVFSLLTIFVEILLSVGSRGQTPAPTPASDSAPRYLDQTAGMTADQAVALALENNGEILALRKEVEVARALAKQAGLRPNPKIGFDGTKQVGGTDNMQMAEVMVP